MMDILSIGSYTKVRSYILKYAIFADIHLGSTKSRLEVKYILNELRDQGYKIVFGGDIFDLWRDEEAPSNFEGFVLPGDTYLQGNHDFGFMPEEGINFSTSGLTIESGGKKVFVTHGDEIDFFHGFAMAELCRATGQGPLWLRLVGMIRKWRAEDVFDFYKAMDVMPDWALEALEHGGKNYIQRFRALAIFLAICLARFSNDNDDVLAEMGAMDASIINQEPEAMYERIAAFRNYALDADHIVIGHIHRPRHHTLANGKELTVLGAWLTDCESTYLTVEDGVVTEHKL